MKNRKDELKLFGVCYICDKHLPVEIVHSNPKKLDDPNLLMPVHSSYQQEVCEGSGIEARWTFTGITPSA